MENQKTIFITSFYGLIGRNLLATDVLRGILDNPQIKVVILLPEAKQKMYQDLFGSDRVVVEGVSEFPENKLEKLFAQTFFFLSATKSAQISYRSFKAKGKYLRTFFLWLIWLTGRFKPVRKFSRWLDYTVLSKNKYKKYFDKHKPSLVFATDIFRHQDVDVMRGAKSRGIFTLGMVRSWDNISTKGLNRFVPGHVVVHGEKIKEDILERGDIAIEKIGVVGVPHYDRYVKGPHTSREEFFKTLRLDPSKKTLVLSPPLRTYTTDPISEAVVNALSAFNDLQIVIRMSLVGKANIGNLKPIPGKLAIDAPSSAGDFDQADITEGDKHLADLLYHCDALAAHISTLAIDAIIFDKPAFFLGFNTKPMSYHEGVRWYFDMDCGIDLIDTGAVKLSESAEEFAKQLRAHLDNPSLGKREREKLRERYCFKLDGRSGERLAKVILKQLH